MVQLRRWVVTVCSASALLMFQLHSYLRASQLLKDGCSSLFALSFEYSFSGSGASRQALSLEDAQEPRTRTQAANQASPSGPSGFAPGAAVILAASPAPAPAVVVTRATGKSVATASHANTNHSPAPAPAMTPAAAAKPAEGGAGDGGGGGGGWFEWLAGGGGGGSASGPGPSPTSGRSRKMRAPAGAEALREHVLRLVNGSPRFVCARMFLRFVSEWPCFMRLGRSFTTGR
mmetsp:Transcript_7853/g.23606  ORF Transcript_7853/g.23606 Transcript_7853/m.23606 type:complete len:232 (+) Transcript_7853:837-1532(+)